MALHALGSPSLSEWWTAPLLFCLGCCALHLTWELLEKRRRGSLKPWSSLPGPRAYPLIGNALEFASMPAGRPQIHRLWQRLSIEHGPLYRVSLPFKKFVVVADPALVSGVLGRKGLPKTGMYRVTLDVFSFRGRHDNMFTVMATHDPKWLTARKGFAATVSEESVRARFALVVDATEKLRAALDARVVVAADAESKDKPTVVASIEMQEASLRLALDVILGAAFEAEGGALEMMKDRKKKNDGEEEKDISTSSSTSPSVPPYSFTPCPLLDSLHECFEYIYGSLQQPWLLPMFKVLPFLPAARRHRELHERLYGHWSELIAHVRAKKGTIEQLEGKTAPEYDASYGACLVRLIDPKTGKLQRDEQILSQASATVVAGMDTTAHALSFALLCIATTPGVQDKVAAELASLGLLMDSSSESSTSSPRPIEYADLSKIPYITAVIKESMRVWPVGGAGVGRVADRDVDIGGFLVKKGTEVAVPMFALHRATWAWTEPERFDPGRWLEGEGEEGKKTGDAAATVTVTSTSSPSRKNASSSPSDPSSSSNGPKPLRLNLAAYLPFSSGPRDCLGRRFGMMELGTMLIMLCSKYRFEFDEALNEGGLKGLEAREVSKFTLSFDGGLWMKATPR